MKDPSEQVTTKSPNPSDSEGATWWDLMMEGKKEELDTPSTVPASLENDGHMPRVYAGMPLDRAHRSNYITIYNSLVQSQPHTGL